MKNTGTLFLGTGVLCLGLAATLVGQQAAPKTAPAVVAPAAAAQKPAPAASHAAPKLPATATRDEQNAMVKRYCAGCHSDRAKAGNLSLASFDMGKIAENPEVAEKMIRKLQAGMMPPPSSPRPEPAAYNAFITSLETTIDTHAAANPNPGGRTFQRLNRPEYARAIQELLDLDVDAGQVAAARHEERQLRQHRRRAGAVADAARVVPERRGRHQPHGGGRQERADGRHDLHQPELRVAAPVGPRRGRAVRHARRHGRRARVPGRRRVRVRADVHGRREHALRGRGHVD